MPSKLGANESQLVGMGWLDASKSMPATSTRNTPPKRKGKKP